MFACTMTLEDHAIYRERVPVGAFMGTYTISTFNDEETLDARMLWALHGYVGVTIVEQVKQDIHKQLVADADSYWVGWDRYGQGEVTSRFLTCKDLINAYSDHFFSENACDPKEITR